MKRRVKNFKPHGLYSITGNASANSLFFEHASDQELFLNLLERFLGDLIEVFAFSTNATGWSLFFKAKDASSIIDSYFALKAKSKKVKIPNQNLEPSRILSEHFRYFLSAYVKQSNFHHGRHGSRVHSRMEKYVFETIEDMQEEIASMREMRESNIQKAKYRPRMDYYLVEKQLKRASVWRNSLVGLHGEKVLQAVLPCFRYVLDKIDVLRQLIQATWNHHFGNSNTEIPPIQLE